MGNSLTRPSANTAIDYEEDKPIIEMTGFAILEAPPVCEQCPLTNGERRPNTGATHPSSTFMTRQRSVMGRLRLFSTFQSAARPSVSSEESHNRLKLSEILASGVHIATEPGEFGPDQVFIRRLAHYEFRLFQPVHNMRILFCKNLDDVVYNQQELGQTITNSIRMRPNMRVISVGDIEPVQEFKESDESKKIQVAPNKGIIKFDQEIYIPEHQSGSKRLFLFIVSGQEDRLLVKAKAIIMDQQDQQRMEYIREHMRERDEKVEKMARRALQGTILGLYDASQFVTLYEKTKAVPKPPVKYLIGVHDVLLGFRIFEPANRDAIVANLIICGTDNMFMPYVANLLSTVHPLRVIVMDLRGFGYSGGKRGHTPHMKTLFQDLRQLIRHVRGFSCKPVILSGHFFGGGIVVNYDGYCKKDPVDGYLLISPILGMDWSFAWRPELKELQKEGGVTTRKAYYIMNQWTRGWLAGSKYVVDMKINEGAYEFTPLHYSRMTANYVRSYQVKPSQFRKLSAPMAIFLAGKDEFFNSNKMRDRINHFFESKNNGSRIIVAEGQTGIQMTMNMSNEVASWITSLEGVKPWLVKAQRPIQPILSAADLASVKVFIPESIYRAIEVAIECHIYDRKPRETDCHASNGTPLNYDHWEPSYLPGRPLGVLIMLAPRCQAHWLPPLAERFRFIVIRLNPWRKNGGNHSLSIKPEPMWKVIGYAIKAIRANHPAAPLLIGGIGYGASLAMGYARYDGRLPVNGLVLITPPLNASSPANGDLLAPGVKKITDPSTILFNEATPVIGMPGNGTSDLMCRIGYAPHLVREPVREYYLSRDLVEDIRSLDFPTAVFLPSAHPYINGVKVFEELETFLRAPFKTAHLLSGDLYRVLDDMTMTLGGWLSQLASSVAPRAPLLLRNPRLSDFEPIEMIGKGTFGKVWLVRHTSSNRFVALKVLDKEIIVNSKQVKQVLRERAVLAECSNCPFIVSFMGSFQDASRLFLAMEFVIGGELFTRLNTVRKLRVEEARFYIAEVVVALQYLHERHIIYRDLKPENIVLDALGHIRLVDFGFARHVDDRGRCSSFCGSPYYIAPEMLSNAQYGTSVDIWALGVLLFELLTGGPPFSGKTANEVYRRILFSTVEIPPSLDSDTRDLLTSLLQPSPKERIGRGEAKGIEEVMKHRWFKGIDWDRVKGKQLPPPYQPQFSFEGDTNNFMKFAGMTLESLDVEDKFGGIFKEYTSLSLPSSSPER